MRNLSIIIIIFTIPISCNNDNKNALELYLKGKEAYFKKDLKNANNLFLKAIELNGELANANLMISKIHYFQKNYIKAIEHLDKILRSNSDHIGALYWKARILVMQSKDDDKREDEAIRSLQKVMELNSHHIHARSLLALLYEKNEKYKEAIYEYKMILQEEETIINARANLSVLYKRLGLKNKSIEEINRALEIAKSSGITDANLKSIKSEIEQ